MEEVERRSTGKKERKPSEPLSNFFSCSFSQKSLLLFLPLRERRKAYPFIREALSPLGPP